MQANIDDLGFMFLGCCFVDNDILQETKILPAMLKGADSLILKRALTMSQAGLFVDSMTLRNKEELTGHVDRILEIERAGGSSRNWQAYEKDILRLWTRGELKKIARWAMESEDLANEEVINGMEKALGSLGSLQIERDIVEIEKFIPEVMEQYRIMQESKQTIPGISFGFSRIDYATSGAQDGQFILICGRPSDGKSALALQIARHIGSVEKKKVGFITIESAATEVTGRYLSGGSEVESKRIMSGVMTEMERTRLNDFISRQTIEGSNILVYDCPGATQGEIRAVARRMVRKNKIKILFVDYLQLIEGPEEMKRNEVVSGSSRLLKSLARTLNIPVVALAQLKRDDDGKRPSLKSIEWSDDPGKDADQCWIIWHKRDKDNKLIDSRIILEKIRDGQTQDVAMEFVRSQLSFFENREQ